MRGPVDHAKAPGNSRTSRGIDFDDRDFCKPGDAVRFANPSGRQRHSVRRAACRGLQADDRHLGAGRRAARGRPDRVLAGISGCDRCRCGPRIRRPALCSMPRGVETHRRRRASNARRTRATPRRARARSPQPDEWNAAHRGSSERIARAILLHDAPSMDANEITDKGYINQRLALERRATDAERLFAAAAGQRRNCGLTLRDGAPLAGAVARLLRLSQHVQREPGLRHVDDIVRQGVHAITR